MPPKEHLTFESRTPAFLRRLRGEVPIDASGGALDPHRHTTPQIRARKPRTVDDGDDDAPVYVDAVTGNVVAREAVEGGVGVGVGVGEGNGEVKGEGKPETKGDGHGEDESEDLEVRSKEVVAGVGLAKRKGAGPKIIGGDQDEKDGGQKALATTAKRKADSNPKAEGTAKVEVKTKKKAGKGKKIKLSFDDDG